MHGGVLKNGKCECQTGWQNLKENGVCQQKTCYESENNKTHHGKINEESNTCTCENGWDGINCEICTSDSSCSYLIPEGLENNKTATCRKDSMVSYQNMNFMCSINDEDGSLASLAGSALSLQCNNLGYGSNTTGTCYFQAWSDSDPKKPDGFLAETFFCNVYSCSYTLSGGLVHYHCLNSYCRPNQNETGSSIFINEQVRSIIYGMTGTVDFICDEKGTDCTLEHENFLVKIPLLCYGRECVLENIPIPPEPPNYTLIIGITIMSSCLGVFLILLFLSIAMEIIFRKITAFEYKKIKEGRISSGGILKFSNLSYHIKIWNKKKFWWSKKTILNNVSYEIKPGSVCAIMGKSGSGKTTLLDILAKRNKAGKISGSVLYDNKNLPRNYKRITGYVLQEDCFLPTMTVRECIRFSADLRLPTCVSNKEKEKMINEIMKKLEIYDIADSKVGDPLSNKKGISGGERKRVSIATELILSPRILYLDEPTSGLDSFSAKSVVSVLAKMAKEQGTTVIFSIHQPRPMVFKLFDDLILLQKGEIVYAGDANNVVKTFEDEGYKFPQYVNPADWILDVISEEEKEIQAKSLIQHNVVYGNYKIKSEIRKRKQFKSKKEIKETKETEETKEIQELMDVSVSTNKKIKNITKKEDEKNLRTKKSQEIIEIKENQNLIPNSVITKDQSNDKNDEEFSPLLLKPKPKQKPKIKSKFVNLHPKKTNRQNKETDEPLIDITGDYSSSARTLISFATPFYAQFAYLSKRAFKNFIRNFFLGPAHILTSIVAGVFLGICYFQSEFDIAGSQNRLGVIFFMMVLLSFTAMSSLEMFIKERSVFMRERANGYYFPISYFFSKLIFDIIPLRVIPPIILSSICYFMIGLRSTYALNFILFVSIMVLFNIVSGALCIFIGILADSVATANIITTFIILFSALTSGLLLNFGELPIFLSWVPYLSYWKYAFEALLINEFVGVKILVNPNSFSEEVWVYGDGEVILNELLMNTENMVFDISMLVVFAVTFIVASGLLLQIRVKEKR